MHRTVPRGASDNIGGHESGCDIAFPLHRPLLSSVFSPLRNLCIASFGLDRNFAGPRRGSISRVAFSSRAMTFNVFLVEDNLSLREGLLEMLEEVGDATVVGVAPTQVEATVWLSTHSDRWDMVIVDLFLSEGSGMEVVKACARRLVHQRVVVLTNYVEASATRALAQGADAVFDKTTQLEEFLAYVQMFGPRQHLTDKA